MELIIANSLLFKISPNLTAHFDEQKHIGLVIHKLNNHPVEVETQPFVVILGAFEWRQIRNLWTAWAFTWKIRMRIGLWMKMRMRSQIETAATSLTSK